jgi:hypothetical protein
MFVAIMGEKKKMQNALSVLPFFSLSRSRFLLSFFLSMHFLFCCTRAIGRIFSSKEKKKKKKKEK